MPWCEAESLRREVVTAAGVVFEAVGGGWGPRSEPVGTPWGSSAYSLLEVKAQRGLKN